MRSSLISKIEKANRYAQERDRITVTGLSVQFRGKHGSYNTKYENGEWDCNFFPTWKTCSHVMALQKILSQMLPEEARSSLLSNEL